MSDGYSRSTKKKFKRFTAGSYNYSLLLFQTSNDNNNTLSELQNRLIEYANNGDYVCGEHLQEIAAKMVLEEIPRNDLIAAYMAEKLRLVLEGVPAEVAWNLVKKSKRPETDTSIKLRDANTVFESLCKGREIHPALLAALTEHYPAKVRALEVKLDGCTDKAERAKCKRDATRFIRKHFNDVRNFVAGWLEAKQDEMSKEIVERIRRV